MSDRNGTAAEADERALDTILSEHQQEPTDAGQAHKATSAAERNERELDAAVRRVAEQSRARRPGHDPSIHIKRVDPSSLARTPTDDTECADCGLTFRPGEGRRRDPGGQELLVHANGGCERARHRAAARTGGAAREAEAVPAQIPATPAPPSDADARRLGVWRDQAVVEWLLAEGPKTAGEIRYHFAIKQPQDVIGRLRARGLIEPTGVRRLAAGAKTGRPGAEYRAVEAETASGTEKPAVTDVAISERTVELEIDGPATPEHVAGAQASGGAPEHPTDWVDALSPAGAMTLHERLVVRYIGSLINSIERASILRDDAPPEHVYDRIERLLRIQDGAA